ncbi:helix-turn-helix domain-containing protein [Streptomyces europaeiscabiei]|uniref:helix-turn-helix domain-containing protein n=1 Tax=Streptomyces europaeiscabiei TaxID=146819 RepID=UPI002E154CA7|nr:helix-turn-helix domain-containing protein [Streptomyces europaeiscabiei]
MRSLPQGEERASLAAEFATFYDDDGDGDSIRAIQARTGRSYTCVRTLLIEAGVTFRENTRRAETNDLADDFARLYRGGLSIRGIRARTGYSYRYIHDLLVATGVQLRDHAGQPRKAAA